MIINRKKNAISGTITGLFLKLIQLFFPFLIRTIYIKTLGVEYLGLTSFYASIIQVLNISELGVSVALVYSMYKPIAEDDKEKICQLMNLYRTYYRLIGFVVLCLGLILLPFLKQLIHGNIPSDVNIYILFLMNLLATVSTYWLFAYRNSLFIAHQRNDVINIITMVVNFILYIARIICLLELKNYYIDVLLTIVFQILLNIMVAFFSKKYYPEYEPKGDIPKEEKQLINIKIRDLFTAKISGILNYSTASVVISSFAGLKLLAIYQNYYYVTAAVIALFNIFFSSLTAGVGNSLITRDNDSNKVLLFNLNYILFVIINFCCTSLVCLYQPFMQIWVGKNNMLGTEFVFLFALFLYSEVVSRLLTVFKDAAGIWEKDKYRPLTATLSNFIFNIISFQFIGLYGIILSTIISLLFISFPWLIYNIDKYMFEMDIKSYLKNVFLYTFVIICCCACTYYLANLIIINNLYYLLFSRLIICLFIPNIIFFIVFYRKEENKYFISFAKNYVIKKFGINI